MSLRDDEEGQETDSAARVRTEGGFSLRHMLASMQSDDTSAPARYREPLPRRPHTTPNTASLSHATISATVAAAPPPATAGRFGFAQLGIRHADALRRISEKGGAAASAAPTAAGGCRATAIAAARPSPRMAAPPTATGPVSPGPTAVGGRPAFAGECNQECRGKLREMARGIEGSARRMREAEAVVGEQSRAFQDAKQRLVVVTRQVETERIGAERLRATVATHERTIAAHEGTIAAHEEESRSAPTGAAIAEASLAKEAAVAERDRHRVALVAAEQRIGELQQSCDAALVASVSADGAAAAAVDGRDAAIALAHSMEEEVGALRARLCPTCIGGKGRREPRPASGLDPSRGMDVSDAAVATGHCLAVGIGVEAGIVDVGGEWGEWSGDYDASHSCAKFYSRIHRSDSFSSIGDDAAHVGTEPAAPTDVLVGAIIADLKQRMEVNIKARIPVAAGL
jgi:hypothetical protein